MLTRQIGLVAVLVVLAMTASATPGQALSICVQSKRPVINKDECMRRGVSVMRRYFQEETQDSDAVFGKQGPDSAAAILCDQADNGVAFFSTSSAKPDVCENTLNCWSMVFSHGPSLATAP